jgi:dethiobiotin synthetase
MKRIAIAGIGTMVGKTVVSAIVCERFGAAYWKPVLSGLDDEPSDTSLVASLVSNGAGRVVPEAYAFRRSLSPHIAAHLEGVTIDLNSFKLPVTECPLVVELAGGVLVPLNDQYTNRDLIQHLDLPVVLVSRHYLGSINHTLLSLEALRSRGIEVLGVVFNCDPLPDTERIIEKLSGVRVLARIPTLNEVTATTVRAAGAQMDVWW